MNDIKNVYAGSLKQVSECQVESDYFTDNLSTPQRTLNTAKSNSNRTENQTTVNNTVNISALRNFSKQAKLNFS